MNKAVLYVKLRGCFQDHVLHLFLEERLKQHMQDASYK